MSTVKLGKEFVSHGSSSEIPAHFASHDEYAWDAEAFRKHARVDVTGVSPSTIEFDMVHVDASLANAMRRILLAEVPTVAIEDVLVWNNTTIVHDEILAQRLGLVPLAIDPRVLKDRHPGEPSTGANSVIFNFTVGEPLDEGVPSRKATPEELAHIVEVYSSALEFHAQEGQMEELFKDKAPQPVNKDILLLKYRGDQHVVAQLIARRGIGKEHAKWSPVSTASYRLHPKIDITGDIPSAQLEKFQKCFSPGVIDISSGKPIVANARNDSMSREVLRHEEFDGKVSLGRIRDHFLFSVESVGQYAPEELFPEACNVMLSKIGTMREALAHLPQVAR